MTLSEELTWRGYINQTTYKDLKELDAKRIVFYHGFDASADSQAVGNLAGMMFDRTLMRHGHKAIIVAGGGTSLIGDPGGKDNERPLQSVETITHNVSRAEAQLKKVFSGFEFTLVNNLDWLGELKVIDYLRDYGKQFSVNMLTQRDYIATRLGKDGEGISYAEFSYTLLQAIDYLNLFEKYDCTLQLGGSDQWGNCLSGVDLIRRIHGQTVNVITQPLVINKSTGKKFGKSEDGAVWLDPTKTSPTQFYQFWVNVDDEAVGDYLKIYTELDKETIDDLVAKHASDPKQRIAQRALAFEVTKLVHSEEQAKIAESVTGYLTGQSSIAEASEDELVAIRSEIPSIKAEAGISLVDALVSSGLAKSNTESRALIESKAIYVDGKPFEHGELKAEAFTNGRLILRRGKAFKDSALLEL